MKLQLIHSIQFNVHQHLHATQKMAAMEEIWAAAVGGGGNIYDVKPLSGSDKWWKMKRRLRFSGCIDITIFIVIIVIYFNNSAVAIHIYILEINCSCSPTEVSK